MSRTPYEEIAAHTALPGGAGGPALLGYVASSVTIGPSSGIAVPIYARDGINQLGMGGCTPAYLGAGGTVSVPYLVIADVDIAYVELMVVSADGVNYASLSNASPISLNDDDSGGAFELWL